MFNGEVGRIEGFDNETREFLAISGGDGDNTGVYPPRIDDGPPARKDPEPLPEGEQFPHLRDYIGS